MIYAVSGIHACSGKYRELPEKPGFGPVHAIYTMHEAKQPPSISII